MSPRVRTTALQPPLLTVVGLLLLLLLAGQLSRPDGVLRGGPAATAGTGRVPSAPVVGALAVCPDLRQQGPLVTTRLAAGVPPSAPDGPGTLVAEQLSGRSPTPVPVDGPGDVLVDLAGRPAGDAAVLRATGAPAAGLEVSQVTRAGGAERGLASLRCEPPRTSAWFVGGSTAVGAKAGLVLVNVDDVPALVDVTVFTRDGVAERRPGRGIAVPARGRTVVPLDRLAPGEPLVTAHVDAQRGRVVAALRQVRADGRLARGVDWVPQAAPPARELVVAALPSGPGVRALVLTNPGEDDTTASVELTTTDGQFVPTGLERVAVPAGTTVRTDLSGLLATTPASVRVVSADAPLLAGGVVEDGAPGAVGDVAFAAATTTPLRGPALLPDVALSPGTDTVLLLSAVRGDAFVEVTPVRLPGLPPPPRPRRIEVPGGRTAVLSLASLLPAGASGRFAVQVAAGEGSSAVHAAAYVRADGSAGPLSTLTTLRSGTPQVPRPVVVRDPAAGASGPQPETD